MSLSPSPIKRDNLDHGTPKLQRKRKKSFGALLAQCHSRHCHGGNHKARKSGRRFGNFYEFLLRGPSNMLQFQRKKTKIKPIIQGNTSSLWVALEVFLDWLSAFCMVLFSTAWVERTCGLQIRCFQQTLVASNNHLYHTLDSWQSQPW